MPHSVSLAYDPAIGGGIGGLELYIDGRRWEWIMPPEFQFRKEPISFDKFGIINVPKPDFGPMEVYLDNVRINVSNELYTFDTSAQGWSGVRNSGTYSECTVRPYHNYGWSDTNYAGGSRGEIGGFLWRGNPLPTFGKASFLGFPVYELNLNDRL